MRKRTYWVPENLAIRRIAGGSPRWAERSPRQAGQTGSGADWRRPYKEEAHG
jgi:hypothetical protein